MHSSWDPRDVGKTRWWESDKAMEETEREEERERE